MLNNRPVRIVHTNKSKGVTVTSRRDSRKQQQQHETQRGGRDAGAGGRKRGREEHYAGGGKDDGWKRQRVEGEKMPSWMGIVTNPRKKMPKDLRPLSDPTKKKGGFKGPRAPVKRKMRNPEKNA
ncbi:RNA binding protein [Strigomonas culicis]|nr:RNA binding protein [Strigomonas culicis]|eukprot:EPY31145.1 RNA binding protein [Strigomonas culicis]